MRKSLSILCRQLFVAGAVVSDVETGHHIQSKKKKKKKTYFLSSQEPVSMGTANCPGEGAKMPLISPCAGIV